MVMVLILASNSFSANTSAGADVTTGASTENIASGTNYHKLI